VSPLDHSLYEVILALVAMKRSMSVIVSGEGSVERTASKATWRLTPMGSFEISFIVASFLCCIYAIALPIIVYLQKSIILFSDVSVYYSLTAIALYLTGRAFKYVEKRMRE
jgi:hypothetical protein